MSTWVSDQTWSQLDPYAGQLRGRSRIVLALAIVVSFVLATAAIAAGRSGLFSPRINADLVKAYTPPGSRTVTETIILSTDGSFDERVTGIAAGRPGLRVAAITALPATIPQSRSLTFTVRITVTDCGAIGEHGLPMVLHLHRFWGTASHAIDPGGPNNQPGVTQKVIQNLCG